VVSGYFRYFAHQVLVLLEHAPMNRPLSAATHAIYKHVAKPVLFTIHPDKTHDYMLSSARFLQKIGVVRVLWRTAWSYQNTAVLGQKLHGIPFINPVGLSAGFDTNFELAPLMKSIGFGLMEGGSLTFEPCAGNPRPWFYRLPKTQSFVVNKGLANQGVDAIMKRLQAYPADTFHNFALNISVAKTNTKTSGTDKGAIADYVGSLRAIKKAGVGQLVTLNISCPNTYGGEPFTTPERLDKLLTATDAVELAQPVFVKMPSDKAWPEFQELLAVIARHNITGVTIHNLQKTREGVHPGDKLTDDIKGNLSGKPTQKTSDELIANTYKQFGDKLTIIGVGGIFNAADAYAKIRLGASLVGMVTGLIFEGPQVVGQINHGLVKLLERDGFTNISQAIGADNPRPRKG
jgi:dihydroorotate dehydrogenase (fumarate)